MKTLFNIVLFCSCAALNLRGASKLDVAALVREADEVILYSLEPLQVYSTDEHGNPTEEDRKKERLHGYAVLGKIAKPDGKTLAIIRSAFADALGSTPDGPSFQCFDPRHAVCLKKKDQHVDLLICFQCRVGYAFYFDGDELKKEFVSVGSAGQVALNELLDSRKILRDIPKKEEPKSGPHDRLRD